MATVNTLPVVRTGTQADHFDIDLTARYSVDRINATANMQRVDRPMF